MDLSEFTIYWDMDGVVADYVGGMRALGGMAADQYTEDRIEMLNRSGTQSSEKRAAYDMIKGTDFYYRLPILPGSVGLYRKYRDHNPHVLTASPKFGATETDYYVNPFWLGAQYNKRRWMEEVFLPQVEHPNARSEVPRVPMADDRFICTISVKKHSFINRHHTEHQVLVDDRRDNCVDWARAGGIAIMHVSPLQTDAALEALISGSREGFISVSHGADHTLGMIHGLADPRKWSEME